MRVTNQPSVTQPVPQGLPPGNDALPEPPLADEFEALGAPPQVPRPELPEIVALAESSVRAFELEIERKREAHKTADAIVSCLTPMLTPTGFVEDQVWLLLLRIMGKIQSERRDGEIEGARLERLQKTILAEQDQLQAEQKANLDGVKSKLERIENEFGDTIRAKAAEENQAIETLSFIMRNQHESAMATLREMQA